MRQIGGRCEGCPACPRSVCPLVCDAVLFLCPLHDYLLLTTMWAFRASGMDEKLECYFVFKEMLQSKFVLFQIQLYKIELIDECRIGHYNKLILTCNW